MTVTPLECRERSVAAAPSLWRTGALEFTTAVLRRIAVAATTLALPILLLAAWSLAARYQLVAPQILPGPSIVAKTAIELIKSGQLQSQLAVSLVRLAAGLVIGGAAGLVVGLSMGVSSTVEDYLGPTVRAVWLVPSLGWLPFFMLMFGIGEALKIVLIAKACFLPMMVNSFDGARNILPKHREVARVLELGRLDTLRFVVVPSVLPHLLTGFRLSLSKGWQVLVLVEMIASAAGIGYLMTWGRKSFQLDIVLVTMVLIGAVGWRLDRVAFVAQTHATAWASRSGG
jgi:sulfonate transport system permease protein